MAIKSANGDAVPARTRTTTTLPSMEWEPAGLPDAPVLFNPPAEYNINFDSTPRYLFRTYTARSNSKIQDNQVMSLDASRADPEARTDVFARKFQTHVTRMVNNHLSWKSCSKDNFVSWTSSLLTAMIYAFRAQAQHRKTARTKTSKTSSHNNNISICVIDTTLFPKRTFIRDADLIDSYLPLPRSCDVKPWAESHPRGSRGSENEGEYLSQGNMSIENKHQVIELKPPLDGEICELHPDFFECTHQPKMRSLPVGAIVASMREDFLGSEAQQATDFELDAVKHIVSSIQEPWRLILACHLLSFIPRDTDDAGISQLLEDLHTSDYVSSTETNDTIIHSLCELQQCQTLLEPYQ